MTGNSAEQKVDLALEADFRLGTIEVRPSVRQIESGGAAETLEPRIMQVLIGLARKRSQVVSRDELIEACWEGRVVGDDALNRCISKIRKLGEARGDFRLETIPRVGYRLWAAEPAKPAAAPQPHAAEAAEPERQRIRLSRPTLISAAVILAVAVLGVVYFGITNSRVLMVRAAPAVAVMPFIDRNGDQEHLAGGMTDELISRLREMEGLSVAGGDWMAGLLKEEGDPQSVGKRLSVTHLLEGGIRQDGKRLKISARLTSTGDGRLVWAEDYEKELGDIFLVQDQIARAVAGSLSVVLDTGLQSTRYGGTANFEAYDHLLRGIALRHSRPPEKPIEQIRKALAIDPNYARAWFELTLALGGQLRIATTMDEQKQILGQMDEASRRAEKLAPNLWFGHAARGAYYIGTNQWLAADQAFQRALATGARDPDMVGNVGSFPQQVGRYKASLPFDELLVELDPYNPGRLARKDRLIYARDFKGAWQAFKEDARPEPGAVLGFSETMWALSAGDLEAAKPFLRSLGTGPNGETIADFLDSPATDLQFIRRILDPPAGSKNAERWTYIYRALVAGHLGDTDLALEFLSRAYLGPGWAGHFPIWYPQLAETRRTEGFKTFVRDLGMVELWRASGDWGDFCRPLGTDDFECS